MQKSKFGWLKALIVLCMIVIFSYQPPIKAYAGDSASIAKTPSEVTVLLDSATHLNRSITENLADMQSTAEVISNQSLVIKEQTETIDSILACRKIKAK